MKLTSHEVPAKDIYCIAIAVWEQARLPTWSTLPLLHIDMSYVSIGVQFDGVCGTGGQYILKEIVRHLKRFVIIYKINK